MTADHDQVATLRSTWTDLKPDQMANDYLLLAKCADSYAARSRSGHAALIIPMAAVESSSVGRRASGCDLVGHSSIHFDYGGREWNGPAAALLCTDAALVDTFAVLAVDVLRRIGREGATWRAVLDAIEEWQTLLAPRGSPSTEVELGLWGELWFLEHSVDVDRALAGWRGPEGDSIDFFLEGVAADIKTSKVKGHHYVSQAQVDAPVGSCDAWLLSLWVKADPGGLAVGDLVDLILGRVSDQGEALKRIARAGFSPSDRAEFKRGFSLLAEPEWYAISDVPRVRMADPGVSQLRYRIRLDDDRRADYSVADRLWQIFQVREYRGGR